MQERARIVLAASEKLTNLQIQAEYGLEEHRVAIWRRRFPNEVDLFLGKSFFFGAAPIFWGRAIKNMKSMRIQVLLSCFCRTNKDNVLRLCVLLLFVTFMQTSTLQSAYASDDYDKEAYAKALNDYHETQAQEKRILQEINKLDPAFDSSMRWMEKRPNTGAYRFLEERFLKSITDDKKASYRDWLSLMNIYSVYRSLETEMNNNDQFERVYSFYLEKTRESAKSQNLDSDADTQPIPNTVSQAITRFGELIEKEKIVQRMSEIQKELAIPEELVRLHEEEMRFSSVFDYYDTYFRFHETGKMKDLMTEHKKLRLKEVACVKSLSSIRPNWRRAEGLIPPTEYENLTAELETKANYKPQRYFFIVIATLILLFILYISLRRNSSSSESRES